MGALKSKTISPKLLSTRHLANPKKFPISDFSLTPRLCVAALKTSREPICEKQLNSLRSFLRSQPKREVLGDCNLETEICRLLKKQALGSKSKSISLSPDTIHFIQRIVRETKKEMSIFERQTLLRKIILPKLEDLLRERKRTIWTIRSWIPSKLQAKDIRKYPRILVADPELDRAHKLSLFLAVRLWKSVFGHSYISQSDRILIKKALSHTSNLTYTCKFSNRVLHVRYDNEIASALDQGPKKITLSSGAILRVNDILRIINIVRTSDTRKIKRFWDQSEKMLKNIICQ